MLITRVRKLRLPLPSLTSMRYRDFRLFWFSSVMLVMTQGMNQVAMGWLILDITNDSVAWLGLVTFAFGIPVFVLTLPAGVLADRWDRRKQLIIAEGFAALSAGSFATLFVLGVVTPYVALVFAFLLGSGVAFGYPARQALIPMLVPRPLLLNGIALGTMAQTTSRLVGPGLAGFLVAWAGFSAAFYTLTGLLVAGLACLLLMRIPHWEGEDEETQVGPRPERRSIFRDLADGASFLVHHRPLMVLMGLYFLSGLLIAGPNQALVPVIVKTHLGGSAADLGLLFTTQSVGTILMALYLTSLGSLRNKGGWFAASMVVAVTFFVGYIFSPWYPLTLVFFFLYGLAAGVYSTMSQTIMAANTPRPLLGRVLSIFALSLQGFLPLGALQAGLVAAAIGPQFAALYGAVIALTAALTALVFARSYRRLA